MSSAAGAGLDARDTGPRAVQITRFGRREIMDIVDLSDPTPGEGQKVYEVSSAGVDIADNHQSVS